MEKRVEVDVDKAYRKLDQTKMMVDVAREELALQRESLRLSGNRHRDDIETGRFLASKAEQWLKEAGAVQPWTALPGLVRTCPARGQAGVAPRK